MTDEQGKGVGSQRVSCYTCGAPLRRTPSKVRPRNYCDMKCRDADTTKPRKARSDRGSRKAPRVERPCGLCGVLVERRVSDSRENIYCSTSCANKANGPNLPGRRGAAIGTKYENAQGYILVRTVRGWIGEHRLVFEAELDRDLLPTENVHHINGVRHDNRRENLELWVKTQPSGQRVEDLVAWAHEILERYECLTPS